MEIPALDVALKVDQNSWSTPPAGIPLLIEESPDFYLLIDDEDNRVLIQ